MADVSGQLRVHLSPALEQAPAMDLLCTQFVLTLTARNGNRFNWRRDVNSLMALAGRHLVWPEHVLLRLRGLLVEFKVNSAAEAYAMMADVAGVSAREVADALGRGSRLERIGMVDNLVGEHAITDLSDLMKVSDQLPSMLMREYRSEQELMAEFTRLAVPTTLQAEDFAHVAQDVQAVTRLLQAARERRETGINILLYGPPGTGKTELAKVAVQAAGLDCFEVEYADRDGNALSGRDRYRSLQIAQAFLKESPRTALLFDEVEDVFPPVQGQTADLLARQEQLVHGGGSVNGKAWVNQILESNPVPVLWVTNRIEQIDPAFRRRFTYHLELSSPPPGARERLVRKLLAEVPVSDAFVSRLTERENLTPAQIANALRFANLVEHEDASQLEAWMERQLAHADMALGHRPQGTRQRRSVTQYDLDMLNVETRYPIARMVEALHARGHGTLCFYGAPGTGKTALAEYIAGQLGKPLMVKQASDLVSKYVGDTEQNMARMFADAERDEAVLLLDEADSFLMDRRGAQRNYEVTEVNEMLQGMERFQGIFICTTNLMGRVDQAALRRFSFKIQFKPLTLEQRERMFVTEALQGDAERLTPELRQRLARMDQLCQGDYAAVRRQIDILGEELFPEEFIEQLEAEHRIKPEVRENRGMGFV